MGTVPIPIYRAIADPMIFAQEMGTVPIFAVRPASLKEMGTVPIPIYRAMADPMIFAQARAARGQHGGPSIAAPVGRVQVPAPGS